MAAGAVPIPINPETLSDFPRPAVPTDDGIRGLTFFDRVERRFRSRIVDPARAAFDATVRSRMNARREYNPVFVTGAMGSGTTLLALSLYQHYESAAAVRESAREVDATSFLYSPAVDEFSSVREYQDFLLARSDWSTREAREHLLALYRSQARGRSNIVIDKGPNANLVRAGFLAECFDDAQIVCVFRDPVAVIEGFRRKWKIFRRDDLDASIEFYEAIHERFLETLWESPERAFTVTYESLVEKHDEKLADIAVVLGLEPRRRPIRLERRANAHGMGIRNVNRGRVGVVSNANAGAYQRTSQEDIDRIQSALGPIYRRLKLSTI